MARWPFVLGDLLLLALALAALVAGETPPSLGAIVVATICVAVGVGLLLVPFLMDYEARVRVAEAAAREHTDSQARRLVQTAENLAHAVSRSQSTEEQAGQALGTLEELAEKLTGQAEDLAQALARSSEREQVMLKEEIDRLSRERDEQFAALGSRVDAIAASIHEVHTAAKKAATAQTRALIELRERIDALPAGPRPGPAAPPEADAPPPAPPGAPDRAPEPTAPAPAGEEPTTNAPAPESPPEAAAPEPAASPPEPPAERPRAAPEAPETKPGREAAKPHAPGAHARRSKASEDHGPELPLEETPAPRSPSRAPRRGAAGVTSLVATAYIGIGNKLFLRGEGPGLNWEKGVPMQFLAIGKWGWTTTEADGPVTCRIFRNDDTPMLDADIVVAPGEKSEVTPRF